MVLLVAAGLLGGCSDPEFDSSTPQKALEAMREMVKQERADLLPTMIYAKARDITFDDGVTEASAIEDVRQRLGSMLSQLWRVTKKIRDRYPMEVEKELSLARDSAPQSFTDFFSRVIADPFGVIDEQSGRVVVEDLGDGTGTIMVDGKPIFGGIVGMIETRDGWRINIPIDLVQSSEFWPQTRQEWAVIAFMMLAIENSLTDFERELDRGGFPSLAQAAERAGRLIGESVGAQAIIYASMKRKPDSGRSPAGQP